MISPANHYKCIDNTDTESSFSQIRVFFEIRCIKASELQTQGEEEGLSHGAS